MIKGTFKRNEAGRIVSFELTGHADAGEYGSDIVCAAVSALAVSTTNGIESLAGFTPIVDTKDTDGGYLYVEMLGDDDISQEQKNIATILLENFLLGLQSTEQEYQDFVEVETITK